MSSTTTKIEWTDATWNPVRGCSRVSEGCRHCYAERIAARFSGAGQAYEGLARRTKSGEARWTGVVRTIPDQLDVPLSWRKPRTVFVNSMSDLFHPDVPESFVVEVWARMGLRNVHSGARHTFQILTKRPDRMRAIVGSLDHELVVRAAIDAACGKWGPALPSRDDEWKRRNAPAIRADFETWPLPNVWLGTSVEHQAAADERIPQLVRTPAAVRFLSCEPLLGDLDIRPWLGGVDIVREHGSRGRVTSRPRDGIGWVIVGGESGPGHRPMDPAWARSLRDQCYQVPFFFKQWGGPTPKSGGRSLDGRAWNEMPALPTLTEGE